MVRRILAIALIVASLGACTNAKPSTTSTVTGEVPRLVAGRLEPGEFRSGRWLGITHPESGPFQLCGITATYDSGRRVYFTLTRNGGFGFYLSEPGWTLTRGERHPIGFRIDNQLYASQATAIFSDTIRVDPADTRFLYDRFREASFLSVEMLGGEFGLQLPGIAAAFDTMRGCVVRHGGLTNVDTSRPPPADTGINPFVPPSSGTNSQPGATRSGQPEGQLPSDRGGSNPFAPRSRSSQSDTSSPAAYDAARRFVERLFTQAGITNYEILTGADVPSGKRHAAVAWRIGANVGTLTIEEAGRYPSVVEASAAIVKDASLICDEGFTSSIAPRRLRDGRPAAQMTVSCARPTTFRADYTLVPVAGAGYYRINLTAVGEEGEVDPLHDRIGAALARIVPEE